MLGGKIEECQQRLPILEEAIDRLVVFWRIFLGECGDGKIRLRPVGRQPNFAQVVVRIGLYGLRQLIENIQRLVLPTALLARRRKRLVESPPKSQRAVADRDLRRDRKTTRLQIDKQFFPALRALPHARPKAEQLLLARGRRADQHQHAFGLWLHPRL
jgi:hypothetical protein